jgi:hypothetical protein
MFCAKKHVSASVFKPDLARHQWFMPVIIATWEAEIRRLTVQGHPGQRIHETSSPK